MKVGRKRTNAEREYRKFDQSKEGQARRVAGLQAQYDAMRAGVVRRDPCPLCNVRADIGCKHGWQDR